MTDKIKEAAEKYAFRVPYDGSNNFYNEDRYKGFMDGATSEAAREYWDAASEDKAVGFSRFLYYGTWQTIGDNGEDMLYKCYKTGEEKFASELYKIYKNDKANNT